MGTLRPALGVRFGDDAGTADRDIAAAGTLPRILVVAAREDVIVARQVRDLLATPVS